MTRLVVVPHRSGHHARNSGYRPLADHIPATQLSAEVSSAIPYRLQKRLARRRPQPYTTASISKEARLLKEMLKRGGGVAHFLNVEHDLGYSALWARRLGWRLVGTFHYPPAWLRERYESSTDLNRLDAAICLGSRQLEYLRTKMDEERIWLIPLGVDTETFSPTNEPWDEQLCLSVGQHMRDFDLLGKVSEDLSHAGVHIVAVVRKQEARLVPTSENVEVLSGIPDADLISLYRRAAFVLLPVSEIVASCALLEALSCGVPVVTNDVGSVRDYVDESCACLAADGDVAGMVEAGIELSRNRQRNAAMREGARRRALDLDWSLIAQRTRSVYEHLGFRGT